MSSPPNPRSNPGPHGSPGKPKPPSRFKQLSDLSRDPSQDNAEAARDDKRREFPVDNL